MLVNTMFIKHNTAVISYNYGPDNLHKLHKKPTNLVQGSLTKKLKIITKKKKKRISKIKIKYNSKYIKK